MNDKTKSLESAVNILSEDKIRKSVSNCAGISSGVLGFLGGAATFIGVAGSAGYIAYGSITGDMPMMSYETSFDRFLEVVFFGAMSVPIGILGYAASGAVGYALGKTYGIAKNSVMHGPITTYKALRNKNSTLEMTAQA